MANSNITKKTPEWANREGTPGVKLDSGPYIGIVKNNLDPARSGRLQVYIADFGGNSEDDPSFWKTVSYASPYYGHTSQPIQKNADKTENNMISVEHTYGMWMIPPDTNSQVLCTFVAGDPDRGYWFACVNENLAHSMLPANGRSLGGPVTPPGAPDIANAFDSTSNLPVTEFNQQIETNWGGAYLQNEVPVHEYQASTYLTQGLDRDLVRGAISSSSQREAPSSVFGISTPGRPLFGDTSRDYSSYQQQLNSDTYTPPASIPARKGGHTFVMDDGSPDGTDQLIRLRTSAGHQVLLNDTEGIVYIANSTGTAWIEMNAIGQVQIYSAGGVAVRSEGDLNLHSDKNVNIQGAAVNINAGSAITQTAQDITVSAHNGVSVLATTAMLSGTGTATVTGGTATLSGGTTNITGAPINLNSGGAISPVAPIAPSLTSFNDTRFIVARSRWENKGNVESIVSVAPTHEPYTRDASLAQAGKAILDTLYDGYGATNPVTQLSQIASAAGISTPGNTGQ